MKILTFSFSLAAVACVAAQVFDPMAPGADTSKNYAWGPEVNQGDLAFQAEEMSNAISELEFRAEFLSHLKNYSDSNAEATNCEGVKQITKDVIMAAKTPLDVISKFPVLGRMLDYVNGVIDNIPNLVDATQNPSNTSTSSIIAVGTVFIIPAAVLPAISFGPYETTFTPIINNLSNIKSTVDDLTKCSTGAQKIAAIEQDYCYDLANMYRVVVTEATKISPALNLQTDASEDLKRLAAGSLSLLDLMNKSSVASTNEALLTSRPIFAADVLDQFRIELLRVGNTDEIRNYAQVALGTVVGLSNALEACLRIAADPIGATNELNDELFAQEVYDEEGEDEDEEEIIV
ncbi:hypothetical protein BGZ65_001224 [Modicella reniformis]|uniref:Uncharacterized protein n=1 Tax=Modicella reniformis TaxID=1440133 RepID=A0A9P6M117_9FUNG|nr:hypothetical protein BGZ65_001224 [Modicella reniformis]